MPTTMERTLTTVRNSSVLVLGAGAVVLLLWLFGLTSMLHPLGGEPMAPTTAICLVCTSAALLGLLRPSPKRTLARALAIIDLLVVAAALADLGLDAAIARTAVTSTGPATSFVLGALGLGILSFERTVGPVRLPEIFGLLGSTTSIVFGFDLLLGLFSVAPYEPRAMSPYAAPFLYVISQALVLAQPTHGWMRALSADTASSRAGQRLLSLVAPIILVLSLLRFLGEERGWYDGRTGVALMAGGAIITLVVASWRALAQINEFERELVHARAIVDAIVENIPHMIFAKDGETLRFTRFNAAGERLLGVKREDLIGKSDFDLFPKEQAEFFQSKDRATLSSKAIVDIPEEQIDTPDGKRWLHTVKVPVAGNVSFLLGISEDITDRKRADDELRHAKEAAEATSKELEAFSYSVSHDLRAPLRSIDGFSQAILEDYGDKLDEEGRGHLRRVRGAAQKMAVLIDDMLNLSRVSRQDMKRETVDVTAIAHSVVAELRRAAPERDVEVVIAPGLSAVGDARLIEVLIENLIGNAWKFTKRKAAAHIEVGSTSIDGERRFFVKDDGAGFDMTYVGKLFGAFQRLHTVGDFEGTGIGLATVQRIAHRHGGGVWADAVVDNGATFTFTLGPDTLAAPTVRRPVGDR